MSSWRRYVHRARYDEALPVTRYAAWLAYVDPPPAVAGDSPYTTGATNGYGQGCERCDVLCSARWRTSQALECVIAEAICCDHHSASIRSPRRLVRVVLHCALTSAESLCSGSAGACAHMAFAPCSSVGWAIIHASSLLPLFCLPVCLLGYNSQWRLSPSPVQPQ